MPADGKLDIDVQVIEDHLQHLSSNESNIGSEDEDLLYKCRTPSPLCGIKSGNGHTDGIERFESLPVRSVHEKFIRQSIEEILNLAVFNATDRKNKVLEWRNPEDLKTLLDLELKSNPDGDEKLIDLIRNTIKYSVKTGHPYFVNQLFSGVDPYALVAQWLTDALNPSVYTFEVSPVFTLMEEVVLLEMRKIVGFPNAVKLIGNGGDGIFCPGGSIANGYAISCARYKHMPDVKVTKYLNNFSLHYDCEPYKYNFAHW